MDWSFAEEQEELAALTRQILERELTEERLRAIDSSADRFDQRLFDTLSEAGVLDPSLGLVERCRVFVELGRAVAPVPPAMVVARAAIGDASIEARLPTLAIVEDLNTDHLAPTMRAERDGDGWVLTGTKTTVPAGAFADLFVVSAAQHGGPALFAVPADADGVEVQQQIVTNTDREAVVELSGVRIAAGNRVGGPDAVKRAIDHLTVLSCAMQLGVCERALELTAEYSKLRVQFDRPIATFQAVGQRLADGFIDVEAIRLTLWQAAWRLSEGLPADTEIATAKFWAADAGHRIAHSAVHVHGGVGIDMDHPLHRYFVAAKRLEFVLGGATEQLIAIGTALADEPA